MTVRILLFLFALTTAMGCGQRKRVKLAEADAEAFVEQFRAQQTSYALQGGFNIRIEGPGQGGTTSAALVLHQPDRFRIDVQTPLRTSLAYVASDGRALHAWVHPEATFYRGDDAVGVLEALAGGAVGLDDLLAILTGQLPLAGAPLLAAQVEGNSVRLVLEGPDQTRLVALVDPQKQRVRHLELGRARQAIPTELDELLLVVDYPDMMRVERGFLPEELVIALPSVGWTFSLTFHTWDNLGVIPDVFTLAPPPGAREQDLVETLRRLAREARPPPSSAPEPDPSTD